MAVNHSTFAFVNLKAAMVFVLGAFMALGVMFLKEWYASPLREGCAMPISYYDLRDDEVTLTRGIYRNYRDGLSRGHVTYEGNITQFQGDKRVATPEPVNREVRYDASIAGNTISMTVTGHNRRLGDKSSDANVTDYVFPLIKPGEKGTSWLYLLEGKALATGTETVPRMVCAGW